MITKEELEDLYNKGEITDHYVHTDSKIAYKKKKDIKNWKDLLENINIIENNRIIV